jgi:hypothetical protein
MLPHADRWMQPAGVMYAVAAFCTHVDVLWARSPTGRQPVLKRWKVAPGRLLPTFDVVDKNLFLCRPLCGTQTRR